MGLPGNAATQELIVNECDSLKELLLAKNRAYGDSAINPIRVFSKASAEEQILVRIDDKLNRLMKGSAAGEDVVQDLIGYLILLRVTRHVQCSEASMSYQNATVPSKRMDGTELSAYGPLTMGGSMPSTNFVQAEDGKTTVTGEGGS